MLQIRPFTAELQQKWDDFVRLESVNGTFLQTKNFLDYHPPERFEDASFLLENEKGHIVAVVPGCSLTEEGEKVFFSHKGSTFGGIVVSKRYYKAENVLEIIESVECYLKEKEYDKVVLKQTSSLFSWVSSDLMEYCLFQKGYGHYVELSTYVDVTQCPEDILMSFDLNKRSRIRNVCSKNLSFRALETKEEKEGFYRILCENLKKYNASPIHSFEEIQRLSDDILENQTVMYGVFKENTMIAATWVFLFGNQVAHTQNMVSLPQYTKENGLMFLAYSLLVECRKQGIKKVSWGISTEGQGAEINLGLIRAKESYGSLYSNHRTYFKCLEKGGA